MDMSQDVKDLDIYSEIVKLLPSLFNICHLKLLLIFFFIVVRT